jgi:DNA-binding NarL/FixJ family response regulator
MIRVLLVDDHGIVRDGLRALMSSEPDIAIAGEASGGEAALRLIRELQPDVVVLDISMGASSGLEVLKRAGRDGPCARFIALSMHEERGYVARALELGASGYVTKRAVAAELVRAIRAVHAGQMHVDPTLAGALMAQDKHRSGHAPRAARGAGPSDRERAVVRLVARGYSSKEIAAQLGISVKTVETHRACAMAKLGLQSRVALVRFASDQGWLDD